MSNFLFLLRCFQKLSASDESNLKKGKINNKRILPITNFCLFPICFNPLFPTYNKSAADDFDNIWTRKLKMSINTAVIIEKRGENIVAKGEIAYTHLFIYISSACFR